jgi:hypothetical protein
VEVDLQTALKTWDCKIAECGETAYKASGPYAMLCRFHTEEAKRKRAARNGTGELEPDVLEAVAPGCRTDGCEEEATVRLGSLWYCRRHAGPVPASAARPPAPAAAPLGAASPAAAPPPLNGEPPGGYENAARRLILFGRRVDACKQAYEEAVSGWQAELERCR